MKTNKFEEILRRKLEGIQPDFQDQDWDKWQSFSQHHTPSFWQSYGQWFGYAVATISTAVMVVLYVNQSNQNDALLKEMESLKQQVAVQTPGNSASMADSTDASHEATQPVSGKPDTVYIIERQTVYREVPIASGTPNKLPSSVDSQPAPIREEVAATIETSPDGTANEKEAVKIDPKTTIAPTMARSSDKVNEGRSAPNENKTIPTDSDIKSARNASKTLKINPKIPIDAPQNDKQQVVKRDAATTIAQTKQVERVELGELSAPAAQEFNNSRNYLYRHLQSRMPQKARTRATAPTLAQESPTGKAPDQDALLVEPPSGKVPSKMVPSKAEKVVAEKRVTDKSATEDRAEEVTRDESLLPKFGLGLPYRVGAGQQWIGNTRAFSLWNEVLLGKHWAVQTGVRWHKLEEQKFFSEKMFRDDMREDIRKEHANKLPPSFEIFNINAKTTLFQIPLGVTYRGDLGNNFTYMVGTATNFNVRAKQLLTIDFKRPTKDFGQQDAERYVHLPVVNNMQFLAGIEKRWSPIVIQASSFVETRIKTFPFLKDRTNVGFQVKLLYEFNGVKKN